MSFLEAFNAPEVQAAAIPGGGSYSTVYDLARFYQMWLNGGELDGVRLLSPALVELATTIHTGAMEDRLIEPMRVAKQCAACPGESRLGVLDTWERYLPLIFWLTRLATDLRTCRCQQYHGLGRPGSGSHLRGSDQRSY